MPDVAVKASDDNERISMYMVNYGSQLKAVIFFNNFVPEEDITVAHQGSHNVTARNSDENPDMISSVVKNEKICRKRD